MLKCGFKEPLFIFYLHEKYFYRTAYNTFLKEYRKIKKE